MLRSTISPRLLALALTAGCTAEGGAPFPCGVAASSATPRGPLPPPLVSPCDGNGWCWENPLPFRDALGPIWHRLDQTVITSGHGHVLRLRDGAWEALPPLPIPDGLDVDSSTRPFDLFVDGETIYVAGQVSIEGALWTWNGDAWSAETFDGNFRPAHLWGNRPGELMAVGPGGGAWLLHRGEWRATEPPRLVGQGLWGCGDAYHGALFQGSFTDEEAWIGQFRSDWSQASALPLVNVQFSGMSGSSNDDVFVVGIVNGLGEEVAWHWDGTVWSNVDVPDCVGLLDVVSIGPGEALATGAAAGGGGRVWRFSAGAWAVDSNNGFEELSVATRDDILGRGGMNVAQFDGVSWTQPFSLPLPSTIGADSLTGLFDDGAGTSVAIATDGSVYRRVGDSWTADSAPNPVARTPRGIWGPSADDLHVVGDNGLVWRFTGGTWSALSLPIGASSTSLAAVFGLPTGEIYAVGSSGTILRFESGAWSVDDTVYPQDLVGGFGAATNDVWVVGAGGRLAHFNGTAWDDSATLPGNNPRVAAVWGASANAVFAVGGTEVWRFDGNAWSQPTTLVTPGELTAVWGRSASDVWAVGTSGTAFHFDGSVWTDMHATHSWSYRAVAGDADEVRAVGDLGTVTVRR